MIINVASIFLIGWVLLELITIIIQGLHHYIKGDVRLLLEKELSDCRLNVFNDSVIALKNASELDGQYIATTVTSILFPYYLSNRQATCYGILIFSKEYFMVRNKFKELVATETKNNRVKFNKL